MICHHLASSILDGISFTICIKQVAQHANLLRVEGDEARVESWLDLRRAVARDRQGSPSVAIIECNGRRVCERIIVTQFVTICNGWDQFATIVIMISNNNL